jgi:hypothetical protein
MNNSHNPHIYYGCDDVSPYPLYTPNTCHLKIGIPPHNNRNTVTKILYPLYNPNLTVSITPLVSVTNVTRNTHKFQSYKDIALKEE